jgi:hypothetical protein
MAIYGYSKRQITEHGLLELSEVTFDIAAKDLRKIASFLNECAELVESGEWRTSHRHLSESDCDWDNDHPDSDVIVIHPSRDPPKVVA